MSIIYTIKRNLRKKEDREMVIGIIFGLIFTIALFYGIIWFAIHTTEESKNHRKTTENFINNQQQSFIAYNEQTATITEKNFIRLCDRLSRSMEKNYKNVLKMRYWEWLGTYKITIRVSNGDIYDIDKVNHTYYIYRNHTQLKLKETPLLNKATEKLYKIGIKFDTKKKEYAEKIKKIKEKKKKHENENGKKKTHKRQNMYLRSVNVQTKIFRFV